MEDKHLELKHRLAFSAAVSLFFSFSLFVYGPLTLYVKSDESLWFSFRSLLVPVAGISAVVFLLSTAVAGLSKGMIHKALCCLIFGISLALYIQGGFFNITYGSGILDGSQINWQDYTTYGAIDSAMWAACIVLPFAFFMVFKRQWRHILMIASGFIIILQIAGLSLSIYQNQPAVTQLNHEVTKEGIYELSENDNTLVFVLEGLDQDYFEAFKKKEKDYEKKLLGFTEYNNTLAAGAGSMISFPAMLTGEVYKKELNYTAFIDKMWKEQNVFRLLDQKKVDARVFSDDLYFSNAAAYTVKNVVDRVHDIDSYHQISRTMYKYTFFNYMPHYLKKMFWMNESELSSYTGNSTYIPKNDTEFFTEYSESGGFRYSKSYPAGAVRIYFLNGAQAPYRLNPDGTKNAKTTSLLEQVRGEFSNIFMMLDDLKEKGRYEDTTIIITADNGELEMSQHPMLLYKPKGSSKKYRVSDAPVTLFDLPATLASGVSDQYYTYGSGKTIKDSEALDRSRVRYFYLNAGSNSESRVEEYKCASSAADSERFELKNNYYIFGGQVEDYTLGTLLKFTTDETAAVYCSEGFGHTNGWRTIIRGPKGQMVIPIKEIPSGSQDLHVFFDVLSVYENTKCVIKANGRTVFNRSLDESIRKTGLNFRVPASAITDDHSLTLTFEFPKIDANEFDLGVNERTAIMSFTAFEIYTQ